LSAILAATPASDPVSPHGQNAKKFKLMVDLGMTPIDALQSAPANDADLFEGDF
jgi:imidazolonepropionase-like amidohydrolase